MNCHRMEKLLLKSFDGLLEKQETEILDQHLRSCLNCSQLKEEYEAILELMHMRNYPEPKPYFWERLLPRLREQKRANQWEQWKQWGIRAIPLSLLIVTILAGVLTFFTPRQEEELSPSEAFLLHDQNPLQETNSILDEERPEDKNMRLIFVSMEEHQVTKRDIP